MNFFLSLSLVLFVVVLNSRSACGFELPHESKVITTPRPTGCGGSSAKNIPHRGIRYGWYARHISPFASKEAQGFTSSSGLVAPHFTNEPRHWSFNLLPRNNAPRTFEGARVIQAPYFAYAPRFSPFNTFPRDQAPFASRGPHGLPPPYFANAQSYSPPHQLRPSAFGGLLGSILQKEFPSVPGGIRTVYFVKKNNPNGVAVTMYRGSNNPPVAAPRPLPQARLIGRIRSDQVGEFLRQVMGHGSTSFKTAFKTPITKAPITKAPFASGGPHGLPPPYFANAQSYSPPHQLVPSAFGGLLGSILKKEFPTVPGGIRTVYFVKKNNPHGMAVTMFRGSNSHPVPAPRPLPKARLIGRIPSDQVGEFLRQVMGHGSTSFKTAFKTPISNGDRPGPKTYRPIYVNSPYRHFPRTVFKPLNIHKPVAKPSQYTPTHVFHQEPMSLRSWFTAIPN